MQNDEYDDLQQYLKQVVPDQQGLIDLLIGIAQEGKRLSHKLRYAPVEGMLGLQGNTNVQGEDQKKLDVYSNERFEQLLHAMPQVYAMVSEEIDAPLDNPARSDDADLIMLFDPLDGSSNLDSNITVGSIFSILSATRAADQSSTERMCLQPGSAQLAAGFISYGPATQLYLTVGSGTLSFTLNDQDRWQMSERFEQIPDLAEYAINHSNKRFWPAAVRSYVEDCQMGEEGPLGRNYSTRWVASMVSEAQRILSRGGVFLYPADQRAAYKTGRIRLLYEAAPVAMLMDQVNGGSSDGYQSILDVIPTGIHDRVSVIFGHREEVETINRYFQSSS